MSDKTTSKTVKKSALSSSKQKIIAVLAIVILSIATGTIVHHSDIDSNSHAMMASEAMQKEQVKKAIAAAAMKQEDTDKMAEHNAMTSTNEMTNSTTEAAH